MSASRRVLNDRVSETRPGATGRRLSGRSTWGAAFRRRDRSPCCRWPTRCRPKASPLIGPLSWVEPTLSEVEESYASVDAVTQTLLERGLFGNATVDDTRPVVTMVENVQHPA